MLGYAALVLGQTLLALVALGLCGGWALWPFRRKERPYLWLATPLAGLFTLGGSVAALYYGARLPFAWCLWPALALNAVATGACLARGKPALPSRGRLCVAAGVVAVVVFWACVCCNRTAIEAREPTLHHVHNNDMFNYATAADWLRAHPASEPPRADRLFETLPFANLVEECTRPVAFLLLAAASEARGTSPLFSYDWLSGVALAAGVLGFGGLFASSSLTLVLLVLGAGLSNWPTNARTGFLGKLLAYPGGLMLAAFFLDALARPLRARAAVVVALAPAVGFALSPVFPLTLLGLVLGGHALALVAAERRVCVRPLLGAVLLFAVATLPALALHRLCHPLALPPPPPAKWSVVIPVALDLELPTVTTVPGGWRNKLTLCVAAASFAALAAAVLRRDRLAATLSACVLVVPLAWAAGEYRLFTFHGLLYPLALAGVAALAAGARSRVRLGLLAALMLGMTAARIPQHYAAAWWYLYYVRPGSSVCKQSEVESLRVAVGGGSVDVALGHYADSNLALAELAARGVNVHLRPPAWERTLCHYAGRCPHDPLAPKSRFALVERETFAPPETVRWVGTRLKLVEDRDSLTVVGVLRVQEMSWNLEQSPLAWVGNTPTTFLVHNGTGRPRSVRLVGVTSAGPARPDRERTLLWRLGEQAGALRTPDEGRVAIPLHLAPGLNRVELSVAEPADPPVPREQPVLLLALRDWQLLAGDSPREPRHSRGERPTSPAPPGTEAP